MPLCLGTLPLSACCVTGRLKSVFSQGDGSDLWRVGPSGGMRAVAMPDCPHLNCFVELFERDQLLVDGDDGFGRDVRLRVT